jgi:arabinan endo-1,5-alpha-L-arabinosidase
MSMDVKPPPPSAQIRRRTLIGASLFAAAAGESAAQASGTINERMSGDISPVHDPCIIKQGDTYYLFCTTGGERDRAPDGFVPCRTSRDLVTWEKKYSVFPEIPAWAKNMVPRSRGIWAPDISFYNNKYHLYYSVSSFGSNHSVIGLATNATLDPTAPDFAWQDQGLVIRSQRNDRFNAIDPNLFEDRDGKVWLSWGSFWTGLKLTRIDPATGKRHAEDEIYDLAWSPPDPHAIEAPFIISRGEYYYLFASYEFCCRGVNSTYFIGVGRAASVTGPYLGPDGEPMMRGGAALVVDPTDRFKAFGHNGILREADRDYLVYHGYDMENDGASTLRISPIYWTPDGWPRSAL